MIKHANHPFTLASLAAAIAFFAGIGPAQAVVVTPLNLQKPPLFLNAAVDPNIAVTFDDSGSMESAFMPDSVDDSCSYRHPKFYSNVYNRIYPEVWVYSIDWTERGQRIGLPIFPSLGFRVEF